MKSRGCPQVQGQVSAVPAAAAPPVLSAQPADLEAMEYVYEMTGAIACMVDRIIPQQIEIHAIRL